MRAMRLSLLLAAGLLAASALARPDDDKPGPDEAKYPPLPWHLVDVWWDVGKEAAFDSYSVDVTVSDDVPPSANLYIAPVGLGRLSKTDFYGGLQTQADGYTKRDRKLRKIGPGLIFSMWGERSLDAIRPGDGGYCQSSGHEGDFVSVRRPYEWRKGQYTYKLIRMDHEEVDGKPCTWVGAFVASHDRDENIFAGALRFKGEDLVLSREVAGFVEVYGGPVPVADIPKVTVTFDNLRVNGKPVEKLAARAEYPKGVPDYADAKGEGGAVVVTVGRPVEGRTERRAELLKP